MRTIFMTILLVAICLSGYRYFIADNTTGLWGDQKAVKGKKDTVVSVTEIPTA